ncbi:Endopeptidase domain containing protein [Pandoravirus salinus]|uniref:Endopeptidase domain containing protein n=1 Tax=Pandoravirus salinus TaxID=1349410 RepID=S4VZU8_9VIRU|nr:Endopeptidase domain [Pandoravirus salinus]AGO83587.1 Endopeptidase domain containing protein [Pandoravirus salinus]
MNLSQQAGEADAAWSGWGEPPRPPASMPILGAAVFDDHAAVDDDDGHASASPAGISKNRLRRQRRGRSTAVPVRSTPLTRHLSGKEDDGSGGETIDGEIGLTRPRAEVSAVLRPLASPLRTPTTATVVGARQSCVGSRADTDESDVDTDDASHEDDSFRARSDSRRRTNATRATHSGRDDDDDDGKSTATASDDNSNDSGSDDDDDGDSESHDSIETPARQKPATMTMVASSARTEPKSRRSYDATVARAPTKKSRAPSSSVVAEGDVISCRTCGAPSTARRSARMGVYVGQGWVVHAVQRRQRGTHSRSLVRYDIVQQTLRDFADGRTLSSDEWFRTRSEFPAAVRVRRALERVGSEWEVPDGLDDARVSEDFALWAATGQSALTHADYRDDRDPPVTKSPSSSRRRGRRDSDERGAIARAVRLRSDSPPPILARIHQPTATTSAALSASPPTRPPPPPTNDYRHVVAGGLVGLYLGGPIGGAVGGAAGLLLDSMASLGRGWRS